jgi:hypothetical protein
MLGPRNYQTQYNSEKLYFMLLVTLTLKTLLSISQNGISPITLNKQLGNHLNKDIINASNILLEIQVPLATGLDFEKSFFLQILMKLYGLDTYAEN